MSDIILDKTEAEECPYRNPALMNYECDGQMTLMDFLKTYDQGDNNSNA